MRPVTCLVAGHLFLHYTGFAVFVYIEVTMFHVKISREWFFNDAIPTYAPEIKGAIRKPLTEQAFIARSAWMGDAVVEMVDDLGEGVPYEIVAWDEQQDGYVTKALNALLGGMREVVVEEGQKYEDVFRRVLQYELPQLNGMTADLGRMSGGIVKTERDILNTIKERNPDIGIAYRWYLFAIQMRMQKEEGWSGWETKKGWGIAIEDDGSAGAMNIRHAAQNANKRK